MSLRACVHDNCLLFSSSLLASILTFCQGTCFGHHGGLVLSLPQPGLPRPVLYFNIRGMKALSWAWVIFSTGVGIPSMTIGGSSYRFGSSTCGVGACWDRAVSSSDIITVLRFLTTSSKGLAPKALKLLPDCLPGVATSTMACWPTLTENSSIIAFNFLNNLVCCLFLMEGFVSKVWLFLFLFVDWIAAAAATPTGPDEYQG